MISVDSLVHIWHPAICNHHADAGSQYNKADSMLAPRQWETSLQSNAVSHWLGANLESALYNTYQYSPKLSSMGWHDLTVHILD